MNIQLLAQDDMSIDTATGMTERWNQYIESYVLVRVISPLDLRADRMVMIVTSN